MEGYNPGLFLKNGHINTIFTSLFKPSIPPRFKRITVNTPDGDFLDLDCVIKGNKRLTILCHGLEGSSKSKYIERTASLLHHQGYDICAMNYRGCSGKMNNTLTFYHSGFTEDLNLVIDQFNANYDCINLIGFSLGGNLILKYLGEDRFIKSDKIKTGIAVSVPLDLHTSSLELLKAQNILYTRRFINSLSEKLKLKKLQFPDLIDLRPLKQIKNLMEFDDAYTAPMHGFEGAIDYYKKCSSRYFINNIQIPFHIINAKDDPFLSEDCYPEIKISKGNTYYTDYGGHVGFFKKGDYCWEELLIGEILNFKDSE